MSLAIKKAVQKAAEFMEKYEKRECYKEFRDIWDLINEASDYQKWFAQSYALM